MHKDHGQPATVSTSQSSIHRADDRRRRTEAEGGKCSARLLERTEHGPGRTAPPTTLCSRRLAVDTAEQTSSRSGEHCRAGDFKER